MRRSKGRSWRGAVLAGWACLTLAASAQERFDERVDTLLAIRGLSDRYGHIQEAIIQPFHPKTDTKMRERSSPEEDDVVGWVALARLVLGPAVGVQAPPNLANLSGERLLDRLLRAGADDFGGVSPMTIDFINPEAPWPQIHTLERVSAEMGLRLRQRLALYPEYIVHKQGFIDTTLEARLRAMVDAEGFPVAQAEAISP